MWRQDNKKVCTCYFCQRGKTSFTVHLVSAEAGPSPSATDKILANILEEQWLHNKRVLAEISQIRRALFQMTKHLKCLVNNTNNIADHLMSEDDEDGQRIVGGGKAEKAAGGKGTGGSEKEKEKKKGKEV